MFGNFKSNKKKHSNALLPNLNHYLDSLLCMGCINDSNNNGINLITLHDSFYVNISNYLIIKDLYRKNYIELMCQDLLKLIILNVIDNLKLNSLFKSYYESELSNDFLNEKFNFKSNSELNQHYKYIYKYIYNINKIYNNIKNNRDIDYLELENYIKEKYKSFDILKL